MFLLRTKLRREACLFNLMNRDHLGEYNMLLAEEGRSLRIIKQKEFMVTGFAVPIMDDNGEFAELKIKHDALYIFIIYDKTPDSPFIPDIGNSVRNGMVKKVDRLATQFERLKSADDSDVFIDVNAVEVERAKKNWAERKKKG